MEFDLKNILVLLFFLYPLLKRMFGKKPVPIPEDQIPEQIQQKQPDGQAEVDWEKELERLFGVPAEAKKDDEITYDEPVEAPRAPVPQIPIPAPIERREREMVSMQEKPKEEFSEFRFPKPAKMLEEPSKKESASTSFAYHRPESLHALEHAKSAKSTTVRKGGIGAMLRDKKQLQQAIILSEVLNRRHGPKRVS